MRARLRSSLYTAAPQPHDSTNDMRSTATEYIHSRYRNPSLGLIPARLRSQLSH